MKKTLLLTLLVLFLLPFTAMSQLVCGDTFTDNGGTDANYQNNTYEITTICSSIPGENVVVTFTSFDVESYWDGLLVYDGDSISSTQIASSNGVGSGALATIPGAFWGTTIPGPFMSSNPEGCLTFRFISDNTANKPGWVAEITCGNTAPCVTPTNIYASNVGNGGATISWESIW
ncbi:MAG TPA: hypothetical protein PLP39_02945 [Flavobacterium lutivivi]|nr:hypothetical protein [Flavobacterium lutivivi]